MRPRALAFVVLALALAPVARAGEPFGLESRGGPSPLSGPDHGRWEATLDNDSAMGFPIAPSTGIPWDRWYTNGALVRARFPLKLERPGVVAAFLSGTVAQNIYTPYTAHVASVAELHGDRPYSGWLSALFGGDAILDRAPLAFVRRGPAWSEVGADVSFGAMGPWSLAGFVQYNAHFDYLLVEGKQRPPLVGWGVVETRPTLTLDADAFAETSLVDVEGRAPTWLAFSGGRPSFHWRAGVRADAGGYLDDAAVDTTVVAGWTGDPTSRRDATFPLLAYLYLRASVRGVAWNGTIDAPLIGGPAVARSAPFVGEFVGGVVARVWHLEGRLAMSYRTNETATLPRELQTGQIVWQFQGAWIY